MSQSELCVVQLLATSQMNIPMLCIQRHCALLATILILALSLIVFGCYRQTHTAKANNAVQKPARMFTIGGATAPPYQKNSRSRHILTPSNSDRKIITMARSLASLRGPFMVIPKVRACDYPHSDPPYSQYSTAIIAMSGSGMIAAATAKRRT